METPLNNGKRTLSLTSPISLSLHKKTKYSETAAPVKYIPNPITTGSTSTSDTMPNTMNVKVKTPSRITDYFAAANKSPIGNTNVNTIEDLNHDHQSGPFVIGSLLLTSLFPSAKNRNVETQMSVR
uniref:Uncharacterized protein n=1 Tax=Caenorhabditis japonica TaxID=281687 RepID=A0A8R1IWV3_CAEJA